MADLRQFGNVSRIMEPRAPIQRFAEDTSEAQRIEAGGARDAGLASLVSGTLEAGVQGYQAVQQGITNQRIEELVGDGSGIASPLEPTSLSGEELAELDFQGIAEARGRGISAERANIAATTRLRRAIANDPGRADAYRAAFNNFFGGGGSGGGSVFDKTEFEKIQDRRIEYGLTKYQIDPQLAYTDPEEWERRFQEANNAERIMQQSQRIANRQEVLDGLTEERQTEALGGYVNSFFADAESPQYLPTQLSNVLQPVMDEDGNIAEGRTSEARQLVDTFRNQLRAQLRSAFSKVGDTRFNNIWQSVNDQLDNYDKVLSGERTEQQLLRDINILEREGILSTLNNNPEAARALTSLNHIWEGNPNTPFSVINSMVNYSRQLGIGISRVTDPNDPAAMGDNASDDDETTLQTIDRAIRTGAEGVLRLANDSDPTDRESRAANDTFVAALSEINAHPDRLNSSTYNAVFDVILDDNAYNLLNEETKQLVTDTLSSRSTQTFISETERRLSGIRRDNPELNVDYNPNTNRVSVSIDSSAIPRIEARRANDTVRIVNRELAAFNKLLEATRKVSGLEATDLLNQSEQGRAIIEMTGMRVTDEGPSAGSLEDLLPGRNRTQATVRNLADVIVNGEPVQSDFNRLRAMVDEFGLENTTDPSVQRALQISPENVLTTTEPEPARESRATTEAMPRQTARPGALPRLTQEQQEVLTANLADNEGLTTEELEAVATEADLVPSITGEIRRLMNEGLTFGDAIRQLGLVDEGQS